MISSEVWNCCLGIIKLSIGIDTSAAIFGIMRFNETKELRFEIVWVTQKILQKRIHFSAVFFYPLRKQWYIITL